MNKLTKLGAVSVAATLLSTVAYAEGLERFNLSTNFMFEEGTYGELTYAQITPDLAPSSYALGVASSNGTSDVAGDFSAVQLAFKYAINEKLDLGVFYTNQGNGIAIDYGNVSVGLPGFADFSADASLPTVALMARYSINDNVSVLLGAKHVMLTGADLSLGAVADLGMGPVLVASGYDFDSTSGTGYVIGAAYEIPDIALRAVLTYESSIDLGTTANDTLGGTGGSVTDEAEISVGDAFNLSFQTGVAQNTLMFGNVRYSLWEDNQVVVPTVTDPSTVSEFGDSWSYSLGVARRLNEKSALSASVYHAPSSGCDDVSELNPQCETTSLTLGYRWTPSAGLNLDFGYTYSMRGDATTGTLGGEFEDSTVQTLGLRVSKTF